MRVIGKSFCLNLPRTDDALADRGTAFSWLLFRNLFEGNRNDSIWTFTAVSAATTRSYTATCRNGIFPSNCVAAFQTPSICDPSHIGGKRELVAPLCQQAMDLGFNGLIVESHCNPDCAWSDAAQQGAVTRVWKSFFNLSNMECCYVYLLGTVIVLLRLKNDFHTRVTAPYFFFIKYYN